MLSCNHDLCLHCAAVVFGSAWNSSSRLVQVNCMYFYDDLKEIKCTICSEVTQLDESSINELEKITIIN